MKSKGWITDSKEKKFGPRLKIYEGRWQDVILEIIESQILFHGIFFDTFGEDYSQLSTFHDHLPSLLHIPTLTCLETKSVYSFFNGLGGRNPLFHDVYCGIAEIDLRDLGLEVEWDEISVDISTEECTYCFLFLSKIFRERNEERIF